jgi:hypothetical protein
MSGKLELFFKMVYESWIPKAMIDKKYKMNSSVQFVIDALVAMSDD